MGCDGPRGGLTLSRRARADPEFRQREGGGFSDLEYALLIEAGTVSAKTIVATTVHPIQILRENLPVTGHDIPVDVIATPRAAIEVERAFERPAGILWDHLQ